MAVTPSRLLARLAVPFAGAWLFLVATSFVMDAFGATAFAWPREYYAPLSAIPVIIAGFSAITCYGLHSRFGRVALALMVGSVVWSLGDLYYTLQSAEPSYPSISDIGYLLGPACWGIAAVHLWRAVGVRRADVVGMAWIPILSALVGAWLIMPTFVTIGGARIGADLLIGDDYGTAATVFTYVYLALDVVILTTAAILWRRSMGFLPLRLTVIASLMLFIADITYNARLASGDYVSTGDIADALYAIAIFALLVTLQVIAHAGNLERDRRTALLARASELAVGSPS